MNFTIFFSPSGTLTLNLQFPLANLFLLNFFLSFVYKEFSLLFFLALLYLARRSELFPYIYRANDSKLTFLLIHPRFSSYINGNFSSLALSLPSFSTKIFYSISPAIDLIHFPPHRMMWRCELPDHEWEQTSQPGASPGWYVLQGISSPFGLYCLTGCWNVQVFPKLYCFILCNTSFWFWQHWLLSYFPSSTTVSLSQNPFNFPSFPPPYPPVP